MPFPVGPRAERELAATRRMRELGIHAPEPVEAFEVEELGVVVFEYIPEFTPLDELDPATIRSHAPTLFDSLATMHDDGLAHGDLRGENVLVADDDLDKYLDVPRTAFLLLDEFEDALEDARAYDVACALAALAPEIGVRDAVAAALTAYSPEALLDAREFLDFVNLRPDHRFDAAGLKGEIEKVAAS